MSLHITSRRMLPSDIDTCLKRSDMYPVIHARGLEAEASSFLTELLVGDQMWGSIVLGNGKKEPLTLGSCVFLSNDLTNEVLDGKHPFLLADMVKNPGLRSHILTFKEVERANRNEGLNFYGALFAFPKITSHIAAGMAMDRLQHDMIFHMRGFRIRMHMKATYDHNWIKGAVTNFAMRTLFGSNLHCDFKDYRTHDEVRNFHPHLFAITRDEALKKISSKVFELMAGGHAVLDLPPMIREILRLDLEHEQSAGLEVALDIGEHSVDNGWKTAAQKLKKTAPDIRISAEDSGDGEFRAALRKYVRQNPQELGILPPLTPKEKQDWRDNQRAESMGV